jgi:hypothetical protein
MLRRLLPPLLVLAGLAAALPAAAADDDARAASRNRVYFNRRPVSKDAVQGFPERSKTCVRHRLMRIENDPEQGKITRDKLKTVVEACR